MKNKPALSGSNFLGDLTDLIERQSSEAHIPKARRANTRVELGISVTVEVQGQVIECRLVDISEKGLRIDRDLPISSGDNCQVTLKTSPSVRLLATPFAHDNFSDPACRLKILGSNYDFPTMKTVLQKTADREGQTFIL